MQGIYSITPEYKADLSVRIHEKLFWVMSLGWVMYESQRRSYTVSDMVQSPLSIIGKYGKRSLLKVYGELG